MHDMMPWAPAAKLAVAQTRQRPVPVGAFRSARRGSAAAILSLALSTSAWPSPPTPHHHHHPLFGAVSPASAAAAPPALSAAQPLSLEQAMRRIASLCDPAFLSAVHQSGRFLYRGESSIAPHGADAAGATAAAAILCPPPDLLVAGTYGEDDAAALAYFQSLERTLARSPVKPSNGHIGVARREAAASWGEAASVWPIGQALHYCWPAARPDFWPMTGATTPSESVNVDIGLSQALSLGREVLFATRNRGSAPQGEASSSCAGSAYIAISAELDAEVWTALQQWHIR